MRFLFATIVALFAATIGYAQSYSLEVGDIVAIEVLKKKEADDRISDLEKLLKGNEGSFAGDAIEAKISELRKLRGQLR